MISYKDIKSDETIRTYVQGADATLAALGYTEHSFAHVTHVAEMAGNILSELGYDERTVELCRICFGASLPLLRGRRGFLCVCGRGHSLAYGRGRALVRQ